MNDDDRIREPVTYGEFRPVMETVKRHDAAIFGYWDDGKRVKGVLEQNADAVEAIGDLRSSFDNIQESVKAVVWGVGKPILVLLGILVIVGVCALIGAGYGILHPDVVHAVIR